MTGSNVLPYSAAADKCFQVIINLNIVNYVQSVDRVYTQVQIKHALTSSYNII